MSQVELERQSRRDLECHGSLDLVEAQRQRQRPITFNDYPGIVFVGPDSIDHPQTVEVPLAPSAANAANIMCIYTGTAVGTIQGQTPADWLRTHLYVEIPTGGRVWTPSPIPSGFTRFLAGAATAAPASLFNQGPANNAGWAVDAAWVQVDPRGVAGVMFLGTHVAVRDSDGFLFRISYQVTAIGRQ
jgi:hypothetical protein